MSEQEKQPDGMRDRAPESRYVLPSERYKRETVLPTETPVPPKQVSDAALAPDLDDSESRLMNLEEWVRGEDEKRATLMWEETFWAEILNEAQYANTVPAGCINLGTENSIPQCIRFAGVAANNRFKYKWREVVKSSPTYSEVGGDTYTWIPPTLSPRAWLSEDDYARNVIENRNIADGIHGNGVNMIGKIPGQESYLPAPPKAIVRMREERFLFEGRMWREYWFQYENEVNDAFDVHCSSTGTQRGGGFATSTA